MSDFPAALRLPLARTDDGARGAAASEQLWPGSGSQHGFGGRSTIAYGA